MTITLVAYPPETPPLVMSFGDDDHLENDEMLNILYYEAFQSRVLKK